MSQQPRYTWVHPVVQDQTGTIYEVVLESGGQWLDTSPGHQTWVSTIIAFTVMDLNGLISFIEQEKPSSRYSQCDLHSKKLRERNLELFNSFSIKEELLEAYNLRLLADRLVRQ